MDPKHIPFDGSDYQPAFDDARLTSQLQRIFSLMSDSRWRTLAEISETTGDPPASISAQLRHLRKERFGSHTVNKRARGDREKGLFEYQLIVNDKYPVDAFYSLLNISDDKVTLKKWVTKQRWTSIDERLRKKGYRYLGNGIWQKETT